jgi:hypothetical protein
LRKQAFFFLRFKTEDRGDRGSGGRLRRPETYGLGWKARDADEREGIVQEDSSAAETNGRH